MKFRAAVLNRVGAPLTIDTLEMAPLRGDDVLVRIYASGLCHTDLEVMQGSLAYPLPIVLGHEGAGVVEGVGPDVTRVKPGDHVICSWNPHCGHCFYCERSLPILCEPFRAHQPKGRLLDGTTRMSTSPERSAAIASPVPLKGTCSRSHFARSLKSSAAMCWMLPTPEEANVSLPGFALA